MDQGLKERLVKVHDQINALYRAEAAFLTMEAAKDHQLAILVTSAPLECSSEASKTSWAKAQGTWLRFRTNLAEAEAMFHREKHMLELKLKSYDAEHLTFKIEESAIRRGVE